MKKFVLKKTPSETLIASLDMKALTSNDTVKAFPVINAWIRDITNGEIFLELAEKGYYISTFKESLNFKVVYKGNTIEVYKLEKYLFYIEETE